MVADIAVFPLGRTSVRIPGLIGRTGPDTGDHGDRGSLQGFPEKGTTPESGGGNRKLAWAMVFRATPAAKFFAEHCFPSFSGSLHPDAVHQENAEPVRSEILARATAVPYPPQGESHETAALASLAAWFPSQADLRRTQGRPAGRPTASGGFSSADNRAMVLGCCPTRCQKNGVGPLRARESFE